MMKNKLIIYLIIPIFILGLITGFILIDKYKEPVIHTNYIIIEKPIYKYIDRYVYTDDNVWRDFKCSGYSLNDPSQGTNSTVAIGLDISPYKFPVIAVDPKVIPLYSIVEIDTMGSFIAIDTGGAIQGNRIDILFDSKDKALQFGRKILSVKEVK